MNFKSWLEADWFHGSHEDFDQWTPEGAFKTSGRKGIDSLGQWLSSKPEAAGRYGPKIYQYNVDLKNPYKMTDHYFIRAFYFPEVARRFLSGAEFRLMSKRPEMEQLVALAKAKQQNGGMFDNYKDAARYAKLEKHIYEFRKIAEKLYRHTDYISALRDHLISRGYDSLLWQGSHIDFRDLEHDVAVLLQPQQYKHVKRFDRS
jgi:hypothetical protein